MIVLTWNSIKCMFRRPMIWLIMVVFLVISVFWAYGKAEEQTKRPFIGDDSYRRGGEWFENYNERYEYAEDVPEKLLFTAQLYTDVQTNIALANHAGKTDKVLQDTMAFLLLNLRLKSSNFDTLNSKVIERDLTPIWQEIFPELAYDDIEFSTRGDSSLNFVYTRKLNIDFYRALLEKDLKPVYEDDIHPINYWYDFSLSIMPYFVLVLVIFLAYQSINTEQNNDVLKLICTSGIRRRTYYLSKWLSGVFVTVILVFVPFLLFGIVLGLNSNEMALDYPIAAVDSTENPWLGPHNYYDDSVEQSSREIIPHGLSIIPTMKSLSGATFAVKSVQWYDFSIIMSQVLLLTILFIGFLYALVLILSATIDNPIVCFVTSVVVVFGGVYWSRGLTVEDHYNLSPLTMHRTMHTVIGINNVTVLTSFVTLLLSTVMVLGLGIKIFNRKSI